MFKYYSLSNTNNDILAIALKCFNKIEFHFMLKIYVKEHSILFLLAP